MSNFEKPKAKCESCLCSECNENINKNEKGSCSGCATCNDAISKCPLNMFRNDYGDQEGR